MNTRRKFRVNKCEESDGSAGRKPSTICCLIPAVPPFVAFLLSLFFPPFFQQNLIVLSPFVVRYLETPDTGRTKASLHLI